MGEESTAGGFRDVDRATRPETFVRYLETVTGIEAVQAYNRRSYELLLFRAGSFFNSLTGFGLFGTKPSEFLSTRQVRWEEEYLTLPFV